MSVLEALTKAVQDLQEQDAQLGRQLKAAQRSSREGQGCRYNWSKGQRMHLLTLVMLGGTDISCAFVYVCEQQKAKKNHFLQGKTPPQLRQMILDMYAQADAEELLDLEDKAKRSLTACGKSAQVFPGVATVRLGGQSESGDRRGSGEW